MAVEGILEPAFCFTGTRGSVWHDLYLTGCINIKEPGTPSTHSKDPSALINAPIQIGLVVGTFRNSLICTLQTEKIECSCDSTIGAVFHFFSPKFDFYLNNV
jgi:hypothetical protein